MSVPQVKHSKVFIQKFNGWMFPKKCSTCNRLCTVQTNQCMLLPMPMIKVRIVTEQPTDAVHHEEDETKSVAWWWGSKRKKKKLHTGSFLSLLVSYYIDVPPPTAGPDSYVDKKRVASCITYFFSLLCVPSHAVWFCPIFFSYIFSSCSTHKDTI